MNEYFHQVLLELLRRDAFALEVSANETPWFPEPEEFKESLKSFVGEVFEFFRGSCFLATAINLPIGTDKSSMQTSLFYCFSTEIREETVKTDIPLASLVEWACDQVRGAADSSSSLIDSAQMRAWLNSKKEPQFFVGPYVVQSCEEIGRSQKPARELYEDMRDGGRLDSFLFTRASVLPRNQFSFPASYYSSAMILGVDTVGVQGSFLFDFVEAMSIMFQMSWGYPALTKARLEMRQKEIRREAEVEVLTNLKELATDLTSKMRPALQSYNRLAKALLPPADVLLDSYEPASLYVPPDEGGANYFQGKFTFEHTWSIGKMRGRANDFRAQFSSVLLAYLAHKIPGPPECWPAALKQPWEILAESAIENRVFQTLFPFTLKRVINVDFSDWDGKDEEAFNLIMKGCFHYPFKESRRSDNPLTGPLLAFWLLELGSELPEDCKLPLFGISATKGKGWPSVELLPALHGLVKDLSQHTDVSVRLKVRLGSENELAGIELVLMSLSGDLKLISERIEAISGNSAGVTGGLSRSVARIRSSRGDLKVDEVLGAITISFPIGA